jgi:hypothetical protein
VPVETNLGDLRLLSGDSSTVQVTLTHCLLCKIYPAGVDESMIRGLRACQSEPSEMELDERTEMGRRRCQKLVREMPRSWYEAVYMLVPERLALFRDSASDLLLVQIS